MDAALTKRISIGLVSLMSALLIGTGAIATLSALAEPQATPAPVAFDIADIHIRPYSTTSTPNMTGGLLRGDRYDLRKATMLDLIRTAYGVAPDAILGGPNWLERDRFDVIAKAPAGTPPATIRLMLKALLADRFQLVVHEETRPVPGFALSPGKGAPRLKPASGEGAAGCNVQPQSPEPGTIRPTTVVCRNVTMDAFAQRLRSLAGGYVNGPITDLTGLKGSWDFEIKWTARLLLAQAGADGISLFDAVDQQLGLALISQPVPAPVLIVDSVNRKPADNPSGVAQDLPTPPPAEFDVADIKLSAPDAPTTGRLQPGGRIDLHGLTMNTLIALAWELGGDGDRLAGAPKWAGVTRYSVVASTSSAIAGTAGALQIDIDDLRLMLRALLVDRFKLAAHFEDRPVTAYTLVADNPKLQKADPANRTGCKEGPAPGAKDLRDTNPMLSRLVTCRNMSLAELAEDLSRIAGGYLRHPVVDATGISGAWDFTLSFTPAGRMTNAGPAGNDNAPGGSVLGASDPTGGLTVFDALSRQLGVKLEMRKRPMPVLVIDHLDEQPSAN